MWKTTHSHHIVGPMRSIAKSGGASYNVYKSSRNRVNSSDLVFGVGKNGKGRCENKKDHNASQSGYILVDSF